MYPNGATKEEAGAAEEAAEEDADEAVALNGVAAGGLVVAAASAAAVSSNVLSAGKQTPASAQSSLVTLSIDKDFAELGDDGSKERLEFEVALIQDLIYASDLSATNFEVVKMSPGSTVVDLEIVSEAAKTGRSAQEVAADVKKQADHPDSRLRAGAVTSKITSFTIRDQFESQINGNAQSSETVCLKFFGVEGSPEELKFSSALAGFEPFGYQQFLEKNISNERQSKNAAVDFKGETLSEVDFLHWFAETERTFGHKFILMEVENAIKFNLDNAKELNEEHHILEDVKYVLYEEAKEEERYHNATRIKYTRDKDDGKMRLKDFREKQQARDARLTLSEVAALRVYTTSAFRLVNGPLRRLYSESSAVNTPEKLIKRGHPLRFTDDRACGKWQRGAGECLERFSHSRQ